MCFSSAPAFAAAAAGVERGRTLIDPGIGFGKRLPHNLELLRRCDGTAGPLPPPCGSPQVVVSAEFSYI